MHLSEINIYPVKSLKGISVESALVEDRGLRFDRRRMLVDEANKFLTQREHPQMARIAISVVDDGLSASAKGSSIKIEHKPDSDTFASVTVWSSKVKAKVYNDATNEWFSDALGLKCRLVLMPDEAERKVEPLGAVRKFKDTVSFADAYPFLLIGRGSLADLNSRLENPVPMNRFRPNLVVDGSEPYAEDTWKRIRIGEAEFHVVKPCARCVLTTVDQTTGEKAGKEPLKTLSTYRNHNGKVMFGQNLIAESAGVKVCLNDTVEILEMK